MNFSALFCSEECILTHDEENFNHQEFVEVETDFFEQPVMVSSCRLLVHMVDVCGGIEEFKKFVEEHSDKDYNVFDFDWSECDEPTRYKNMFLAMIDNSRTSEDGLSDRWEKCFSHLPDDNKFAQMFVDSMHSKFSDEMFEKFQRHVYTASINVSEPKGTIQLLTHAAMHLLVECCNPNVMVHSNLKSIIFTVLRPIKAGSPIYSSLKPFYHWEEDEPNKECRNPNTCLPCQNDWGRKAKGTTLDAVLIGNEFYQHNDSREISSLLEDLEINSKFINENYEGYDTDPAKRKLIATRMRQIEFILMNISNPFPQSSPQTMKWSEFWNENGIQKYYDLMNFE